MQGNVVIQVTNLAGTKIWAASAAIAKAPVLAHQMADPLGARTDWPSSWSARARPRATLSQISSGHVGTIFTKRGYRLDLRLRLRPGDQSQRGRLDDQPGRVVPAPALDDRGADMDRDGTGARARSSRFDDASTRSRPPISRSVSPPTGGDDEIARMARTVNAMLDRLEASSQFEQEFVSNASHELRSPLTTLLATTERAAKDPERADWNEVGEIVMREGRRLETLIDDLAWLARHDELRAEIQQRRRRPRRPALRRGPARATAQ